MSTYAIKADKFFLPADPQLGGYLMVEDGVFGAVDRTGHGRYSHPWFLQPLDYR